MTSVSCYHCGDDCIKDSIRFNDRDFCCSGCKTVYEILNENELGNYYDLEPSPGKIPEEIEGRYEYLENENITENLYDFKDGSTSIITFYIPHIHCSSCIWVLEHLNKLNSALNSSIVDFPKKEVRITFDNTNTSLKELVELLSTIGYEPTISLETETTQKRNVNRSLLYKLAVAGFAFGNIMLLSFPEYFQSDGFWLEKYKALFRSIIFFTSLPVVFYAASDYFVSAYKGFRHKMLNIDVPIVLGILVLFLRSSYEIFFGVGQGYFDSLAGFVFFLLLGRIFQQQTYSFLSFERDYKSYFPIAVTKINNDLTETNISVNDVIKGDRLLIRNGELVPVDGLLISKSADIDYGFVTGESVPVTKYSGDKIFAGGKQISGAIQMEVLQSISKSYLTQLWSNDIFSKEKTSKIKNLTDSISKQFTITVLIIAFLSGIYWYFKDATMIANVVTAVLIVACPCALALSAPFALGNMLRILGRRKMYLKNTNIIENLSHINTIIFDKTGTITTNKSKVIYEGESLSYEDKQAIISVLRNSNHPLSRSICNSLTEIHPFRVLNFKEELGKGLQGNVKDRFIKIGSANFLNIKDPESLQTKVYISINNALKGKFIFENSYRDYLDELFKKLNPKYELSILSGDNEGERVSLRQILPKQTDLIFNQKPQDKLDYIKGLQETKKNVLMIGDGLNDAGALQQSNVGLVIAEDINVFSPASDGIIDASQFSKIVTLLELSKITLLIIKISFAISLLYNLIGMYFAINGLLSPIIAAILMPLSSITIVVFVTIATNFVANRKKNEI